jgi:hypothetical protein
MLLVDQRTVEDGSGKTDGGAAFERGGVMDRPSELCSHVLWGTTVRDL